MKGWTQSDIDARARDNKPEGKQEPEQSSVQQNARKAARNKPQKDSLTLQKENKVLVALMIGRSFVEENENSGTWRYGLDEYQVIINLKK